MRKNYRKIITKQNIRYYYFLSFAVIGYVLCVIAMYAYPVALKSLGGIFLIGATSLVITIYIFNFTKLKKLLNEEIQRDIEKYEEKIQKKEEKKNI